ncbi:hypothetical protein NDU88_004639 [Pleurodeles waltl]|uniref:Uncharacterized protein n=1 Tax=Pleurodeles waltl TaxID=8319 RepID=A0AAV7W946_PLEWA|nr:hypothetical protein NDU88_004639 [Pleurodeles waltl]
MNTSCGGERDGPTLFLGALTNTLLLIHLRTIEDPDGQYMILHDPIGHTKITLLNRYGSNDYPAVYHTILKHCLEIYSGTILCGVDHNLVLDIDLDCSVRNENCLTRARAAFLDIMVRPSRHLARATGVHISILVHGTFTRLDYWVGSWDVTNWTKTVRHLRGTLSDHSPVVLLLILPTARV